MPSAGGFLKQQAKHIIVRGERRRESLRCLLAARMARKTQLGRRIITALLTSSLFTTTFGNTYCRMADVRISSSWWTGLKWTLPDDGLRLNLWNNNIGHEGGGTGRGTQDQHRPHHADSSEEQYRPRGGGGTGRGTQDQHRPHHAEPVGEQYRPRGGGTGRGTQDQHRPHHAEPVGEQYRPRGGGTGRGT